MRPKIVDNFEISECISVVRRVGGDIAAAQFSQLFTSGFPAEMQPLVLSLLQELGKAEGPAVSGAQTRTRAIIASAKERSWNLADVFQCYARAA
jgi:hypothetical protein